MRTADLHIERLNGPRWSDWLALTRPRLAQMGLTTVLLSYVVAGPVGFTVPVLIHLLLGSLLALCGASVGNQVLEHEVDGRMRRTADRPLPAGRVGRGEAVVYGVVLTVLGLLELAWGVNLLTAGTAAVGIALYLVVYTPLKCRTSLSTVVGAVPGAVPVLMGWAAARGGFDVAAWSLFAILFLWQLPHFLAIAWMYRADYERAGLCMLPVEDPAGASTARQVILSTVALVPVSLLPTVVGLTGPVYFVGALVFGLGYLVCGLQLGVRRNAPAARRLLRASVAYLPLLFGLMALDRLFL